MERKALERYLAELETRLRRTVDWDITERVLLETEEHLERKVIDLKERGLSEEQAAVEAVAAFGSARALCAGVVEASRPRPFGMSNWMAFLILTWLGCLLSADPLPTGSGPGYWFWFFTMCASLLLSLVACFMARRFPLPMLMCALAGSFVLWQIVAGLTTVDLGNGRAVSRAWLVAGRPEPSLQAGGSTPGISHRLWQLRELAVYAKASSIAFAKSSSESDLSDEFKPWTNVGRKSLESISSEHLQLKPGEYIVIRTDLPSSHNGWKQASYPMATVAHDVLDGHARSLLMKAGSFAAARSYWKTTGPSLTQSLLTGIDDTAKVREQPFQLIRRNLVNGYDCVFMVAVPLVVGQLIAWLLSLVVPVRRRRMKLV